MHLSGETVRALKLTKGHVPKCYEYTLSLKKRLNHSLLTTLNLMQ